MGNQLKQGSYTFFTIISVSYTGKNNQEKYKMATYPFAFK